MTAGLLLLRLDLHLVDLGSEVGGIHLAHRYEFAIDGEFEHAGIETFFSEWGVEFAGRHEAMNDEEKGIELRKALCLDGGREDSLEHFFFTVSTINTVEKELPKKLGASGKEAREEREIARKRSIPIKAAAKLTEEEGYDCFVSRVAIADRLETKDAVPDCG